MVVELTQQTRRIGQQIAGIESLIDGLKQQFEELQQHDGLYPEARA